MNVAANNEEIKDENVENHKLDIANPAEFAESEVNANNQNESQVVM